ncbi:MAG: SHOCT domain-containing protein [Desulfovibrionales bacterium]
MLFLFAVLVLLIWMIARSGRRSDSSREDRSLEITRERYARGEINREEFQQIRNDLGKK